MFTSLLQRHSLAAVVVTASIGLAMPTAQADSSVIASGQFQGRGGHTASGSVTILETDSGIVVRLESDFQFDGAPDPKLGFGNNGYDPSTKFSPLRANRGAQTYLLTTNLDPEDYSEFWIWCEEFSAPLAVADLN